MVPERVVHLLEPVEVHQQHAHVATALTRVADRRVQPVLEERAVRKAGEGIVQRLVLALASLLVELVDEAAVLEGDAGVVGQRLEQARVLDVERRHIRLTVGHGDHADHDRAAHDRRDQQVTHTRRREEGPLLCLPRPPADHHRALVVEQRGPGAVGKVAQELAEGGALGIALGALTELSQLLIEPHQVEVAELGAQEVAGLAQHVVEHVGRLHRAAHLASERVEGLEPFVAPGQQVVGAVADVEGHGHGAEEPDGGRVHSEQQQRGQAEARVGDGRGRDRDEQRPGTDRSAVDDDDGDDGSGAHHIANDDRQHDDGPGARVLEPHRPC